MKTFELVEVVNCAATTTCTCVIWTALPALHLPTGTRRGYPYQQTASSAPVHQLSSTSINYYSPFRLLHPHKPAQPTLLATNQHSHQRSHARNGPPLPTPNLPLLHHRRRLPLPLIITLVYFPEQSTAHSLSMEEQQYPRTRLVKREYTKRGGERSRENESE